MSERDDLLAPDPEERCTSCGEHVDDPCRPDCDCHYCQNAGEAQAMRRYEDGMTSGERYSLEREMQIRVQRDLK